MINHDKTAFLFMDFQNFILENFLPPDIADMVVKNAAQLLAHAREVGLFIVHVTVCFRPDYPEISAHNKMFSLLKENGLGLTNHEGSQIHPALTPLVNEPVIRKRRVSAFESTDLDMILRSQKIENLILSGVTTSNVILSTFNRAVDLDYNLTVIKDCCGDKDQDSHDFFMAKIFPQLGNVCSSHEIRQGLTI